MVAEEVEGFYGGGGYLDVGVDGCFFDDELIDVVRRVVLLYQ